MVDRKFTTLTKHKVTIMLGIDYVGLFMGWTDPITKCWYPIRKMSKSGHRYQTSYVNGVFDAIANSPNMRLLFERKIIVPNHVNLDREIPSIYARRMPIFRPEDVVRELEFIGLSLPLDPIAYAARSGGYSIGDGYDLFPAVAADRDGNYHFYFLSQNLDRDGSVIHEYIDRYLSIGTSLQYNRSGYLYHRDRLLGKLPGYLIDLIGSSLDPIDRSPITIEVAKINSQVGWGYYHLLCHATVKFVPFTTVKYQQVAASTERHK
jgi:hypothetical protein